MKMLAARLLAAILLALAVVFAAVRVLDAVRPPISEDQARVAALAQLSSTSRASGFRLVSARRVLSGVRVTDDSGNVIYSESRSGCPIFGFPAPGWLCPAGPVWVLHFRAPPQNGFLFWEAYVVVDGQTGKVSSASTNGTNQ